VSTGAYGRDALRRFRDHQTRAAQEQERQPSPLEQISPDAQMDDATITAWTGERFMAYQDWMAIRPVAIEEKQPGPNCIPADATCVAGDCGGTRVWLVRDGDRWSMFVGSRNVSSRRRDFASPFLAHAMRTAELWYGAPAAGWRAERCA